MVKYNCNHCNKEYRLKHNHDRHVIVCEFLSKSRLEQNDELDVMEENIPTIVGLYKIIQSLSIRMDKLEKENSKLRQYSKKRINIVHWLNDSKSQPDICFDEWITNAVLPLVSKCLDTVYNNNLLEGLKQLFTTILENKLDILPIRCFDNKPNVFYIYQNIENQLKWSIIITKEFDRQLNRIGNQFILDFKNNWYLLYREKIETDEKYKDMYINYYQKILGGDDKMTDESRFQKLKIHLYQKMKENIKSIVEYDVM